MPHNLSKFILTVAMITVVAAILMEVLLMQTRVTLRDRAMTILDKEDVVIGWGVGWDSGRVILIQAESELTLEAVKAITAFPEVKRLTLCDGRAIAPEVTI